MDLVILDFYFHFRFGKPLTIKLTAIEFHAECSLLVPFERVKPNESSNHRRKKSIFLHLVGVLVATEYLVMQNDDGMMSQLSLSLWHPGTYQSKPSYLGNIPAVSLIESPPPPIVAVGDVVADNILGMEELFGSLSGHLADYYWSLKVHLWKRLMVNNAHARTHTHART